jgi:Lipocalin-like domain
MGLSKFLPSSCFLLLMLLVLSCSKDDVDHSDPNSFYSGAATNASSTDLLGYWAITEAEYEGTRIPIPINYTDCGRDFFVYRESGFYEEYVYTSSACETISSQLQWELDKGVLTMRTLSGSTDDLVIIKLTATEFQFKARVDIDEDGELDVVVLIAKRYTPDEKDFYTQSFRYYDSDYNYELIGYTWQPYDGFHTFEKYEIYRGQGENCSKANAELVATITDVNETEYFDLEPPVSERLCYFLRIYTDQGVLGDSYLETFDPSYLRIAPVNLNEPTVTGNTISLSWGASDSPYFSHYEILVRNHEGGTGYGFQEKTVAIVSDRETTSWMDENPPYFENPYYHIRVHTLFGYKTDYSTDATTYWQVPFKRPEILSLKEIKSYAIDPSEPVIYFWGQESGEGMTPLNMYRFNYDTHRIEAIANIDPQYDTDVPIKVIVSQNGKELIIKQGIELHFYDASTMQFKYAIDPETVFSIGDFNYDPLRDIWVISDSDDIFTLQRDNSTMSFIDTAPHFVEHQGSGRYKFIILNNGQIILGHRNETTSFVFDLDANGNFTRNQSVNIQFRQANIYEQEELMYNAAVGILVDSEPNRMYSSTTFQNLGSFEKPNFPTGLSADGSKIFGTDNDYEWNIDYDSPHKKEALIFDRNSSMITTVETVGYPHILFENFRGELMSISSGLKRATLYRDLADTADIFIEKVDVP